MALPGSVLGQACPSSLVWEVVAPSKGLQKLHLSSQPPEDRCNSLCQIHYAQLSNMHWGKELHILQQLSTIPFHFWRQEVVMFRQAWGTAPSHIKYVSRCKWYKCPHWVAILPLTEGGGVSCPRCSRLWHCIWISWCTIGLASLHVLYKWLVGLYPALLELIYRTGAAIQQVDVAIRQSWSMHQLHLHWWERHKYWVQNYP